MFDRGPALPSAAPLIGAVREAFADVPDVVAHLAEVEAEGRPGRQ